MRLFIATDISEDVKQEIERIKQPFSEIKGVKPVRKENMHITLKFLGEVKEDYVSKIKNALSKVSFEPFKMSIDKIGYFPNEKQIRVLWIDAVPVEPLAKLKKQIDAVLPEYKDNYTSFSVHLTFARVKYIANDEDKKKLLEFVTNTKFEKKEFVVDKFKLYQSTLSLEGPVYEDLASFPNT
ncbi:MAG: RNA 2',3'-cyclic phosphodiesterase [Nanoarchaeota archaeon]|nr:RNA 2',3'-cyclic phosphodiesterase [Nanoarchaeota archaeon]MBU1322070.1 RNA 2',3'-cyclic phosphodiesterase [Nanoarchaeota archaeon]MBU1598176.1 RNA 2',3'-cyclic phosphodiesterase [Nanoarchaeota archaeon]MBU2441306.1 RNA 2',3'-cyclic phosphodiesterase [Nanoarchaeota archaeon]